MGKLKTGHGDQIESLTHIGPRNPKPDHQLKMFEQFIKNQGKCRRAFLPYPITLWEI